MTLRIGFKTSPQDVDWPTLDATWARAGELGVFDSGWLNDHLTNMDVAHPGPSFEALTLLAALVHHVPGVIVGHGVLSNTFRHPVLLAKAATLLDHATGGHFVLGLGAGWFEGEHEPFGIDLPPIGERIDRLVSAVGVLEALFSPTAAGPPGVTRPDPFYPLRGATNLPAPFTVGGPPLYLGGQRPRGIALAARSASGWLLPGTEAGDAAYFREKRGELLAAMVSIGRDPSGFDFVGQVSTGHTVESRTKALADSRALVTSGATHVILGFPASLGVAGIETIARELVEPLRAEFG
ncbi:MAG TPA: LLM class flavin-dependent oxidoreductase [Candidatus Limnocylindrales bacterium]|nr:LLM class flavin-dependent oxidoreductase [Candidatus Limnocylindrales bacterium]